MLVRGQLRKCIQRNFCSYCNLPLNELLPPAHVRQMTILDRDQFRKTVSLPVLDLSNIKLRTALPHLKQFTLKIRRLKTVQVTENGHKKLLLQPMAVKTWNGIPDAVQDLGITEDRLSWQEYELTYDNWNTKEILKSVLPKDQEELPAISHIGHIIHLNLREHLLPYKTLIGEVLLDKETSCRTVINKTQAIKNTFRNFQFELLSGAADLQVTVKENECRFEFDFSTVYWNPRLSKEHERIVELLESGDVLYDVFAGVGPFSVPAGKKCTVLANDLNPESFKWLQTNIRRNKVTNFVTAYNKDGRDFICNEIKDDLTARWRNSEPQDYKIHITMNLPAMVVEFLNCFCGLLNNIDEVVQPILPLVHVYCFANENAEDIAKTLVETSLGQELGDYLDGIYVVKRVQRRKTIYRLSFYLTREILTAKRVQKRSKSPSPDENVDAKKMCSQ